MIVALDLEQNSAKALLLLRARADEWIASPKRVRQQSVKYSSGYMQEFNLDVFEHLKVVDLGDADIPPEVKDNPTAKNARARRQVPHEEIMDHYHLFFMS